MKKILTVIIVISAISQNAMACGADIDNSGRVNARDYTILRKELGTNSARSDLNKDGIVNALDVTLLRKQMGAKMTCPPVVTIDQAKVSWSAVPDPLVAGYVVYHRKANEYYTGGMEAGNALSFLFTNLYPGVTHYFVVTSYYADGRESEPSNEVSKYIPIR